MPVRKVYTPEQRQAAVAYVEGCGGNIQRAAKETGIPWSTLKYWVDGGGIDADNHELRDEKREAIAALFETEAREAVMAAGKVRREASYAQLMTGAAIATDKAAMLREKLAVSPERFNQGMELIQRALSLYVSDPAALENINAEFDAFLRGDAASGGECESGAGGEDGTEDNV